MNHPTVSRPTIQTNPSPDSCLLIPIRDRFIELSRLLKLADVAASGGEAKHLITAGQVLVNGVVEHRKRRKIVPGDLVRCQNKTIRIAGGSADRI